MDITDWTEWQRLTGLHDSGVFFQRGWLEAFQANGATPRLIKLIAGTDVVALAAGLETRSRHKIAAAVSRQLYLLAGLAICGRHTHTASECLRPLIDYARAEGYVGIFVGSYDCGATYEGLPSSFTRKTRIEHIVDLTADVSELHSRLTKGQKSTVKKAERLGLELEEVGPEGMKELLECLQGTKEKRDSLGYGAYSPYYMPLLDAAVADRLLKNGIARIFRAKRKDDVLCSWLAAIGPRGAYALLSGSTPDGYSAGASPFSLWGMMLSLKARGCLRLNLGGTPTDQTGRTLAAFKRSFGAKEQGGEGCFSISLQAGSWRNLGGRIYRWLS